MKLTSPDEVMIQAADSLIAVPQRRGVPLPLVTLPLPFVEGIGCGIASAGFAGTTAWIAPTEFATVATLASSISMAATFAVVAIFLIRSASRKAGQALREAEAWSPEAASRHRSTALKSRETRAHERYVWMGLSLMMAMVLSLMFRVPFDEPLPPSLLVTFLGLALACVGRLATDYGDCAFPWDPDLRRPARLAPNAG